MKLTNEVLSYLQSDEGKNIAFQIPRQRGGSDRKSEIIRILKENNQNNIIHVGCCGHLQGAELQLERGEWFHDQLCSTFPNVIGTDINERAIDFFKKKGKERLYCKDIIEDFDEIYDGIRQGRKNDKINILLPEVLEHVMNPYLFLKGIKEKWTDKEAYLLISVPNALGSWNINNSMRNKEIINCDHKYTFTPFTILKLFQEAKIDVLDIQFTDMSIFSKLFKLNILSNTLVIYGKL